MHRVIIVDDHKIFRDGFKMVIDSIDQVQFVGEATNGKEFLDLIKSVKADVVFMDVNMPVVDGAEATQEALKIQPDLKIIAITSYDSTEYVNKMLFAGVEGYLLKDADYEEIEEAIQQVVAGRNYFSKQILVNLTKNTIREKEEKTRKKGLPNLSPRETEVLDLVCKGLSKTDIAGRLFISERTVEKHKENLMAKTGTKSTVNLVLFSIKNKLVNIE